MINQATICVFLGKKKAYNNRKEASSNYLVIKETIMLSKNNKLPKMLKPKSLKNSNMTNCKRLRIKCRIDAQFNPCRSIPTSRAALTIPHTLKLRRLMTLGLKSYISKIVQKISQ